MDNPRALVVHHDAVSRSVQFNDKLIAFAKHWGFRPRACAPYRARTKGKTENGVGYVKKNAIAGHSFASWEAFEAHLAKWEYEVANVRIHGTTGEAPIARFERDEAHRLKPVGGRPSFGSLRELTRVVGNDCAVEIDTNSYSVPWRLIGERVAVTVAAGEVHIRHGVREVAVHKQSEGRRLRIVDSAHLDGVAGRDGAVCRPEIAAPTVPASSPPPSLCVLLPNTKQRSEEASDGARKESNRSADRSARRHAGAIAAPRHPRPARQPARRGGAREPVGA
jgi:hypothetical protein